MDAPGPARRLIAVPASSGSVFPLVPRYRVAGLPFGGRPSQRRGHGSDVASSRPYVRGDPLATIDWRASARLSSAHARDELVVRSRYSEEAPRVVVFRDYRPSMGLYPPPFPWLSKPEAARAATDMIVRSAEAANAAVAYLDFAGPSGKPYWLPPTGRDALERIDTRRARVTDYDAPDDSLTLGLGFLERFRTELSSGTFVFVISDFLGSRLHEPRWLTATARRWEMVPVIVQDRVWEQTFPNLGPVVLPLVDPGGNDPVEARLSRRQASARRVANEARRRELLARLALLGLDPVLLDESDVSSVERAFLDWAARRRDLRQRR